MTDDNNDEYIHELIKYKGTRPCPDEVMRTIHDKVIDQGQSNFIPEISPNYNPNTGRLESNSKPVGLYGTESGNRPLATKWTIKED